MTDYKGKIGIIGGSYDPIHLGHLFLAETAYAECGLDRVLFMPTPAPYHKAGKEIEDLEHRINMTKLAIKDNPHFEFSDFELGLPGDTYTYKTLENFKKEYPETEVYFIVGGDSLFSMENWVKPEKIFELATIISSKREDEGKGASGICRPSDELFDRDGDGIDDRAQAETLQDEFSVQADYLRKKFGARIIDVKVPNIEISSSAIKNRIKAGKSVKYYLPDAVIEYIKENRLYI